MSKAPTHGGGKPHTVQEQCQPPVGPKNQDHVGPGMGPGGKNEGNSGSQGRH